MRPRFSRLGGAMWAAAAMLTVLLFKTSDSRALPPDPFTIWQEQYFGSTRNPIAAPDADLCGKGITNTNQFLLGLDPTNCSSVFRILSVVQATNLVSGARRAPSGNAAADTGSIDVI